MKAFRTLTAIALLGASLSIAGAQGMRMMGGGAAMSKGMILYNFRFGGDGPSLRSDVSKELKITDAQKGKLDAFQQKQMEQMMPLFQGGERPSQEELQKIMKKRQEDEDKALKETFDESQLKRLTELWIQRMGNGAYANPEIQKELGFSPEQVEKIKKLQTQQQEAMTGLFQKMQNGEIDRSEIRPMMEKANKILNEEYAKVATAEQAEKLKKMGGAPFKFDEDQVG